MPIGLRRLLLALACLPIAHEVMACALVWSGSTLISTRQLVIAGLQTGAAGLSFLLALLSAAHALAARHRSIGWRLGWGAFSLAPFAQIFTTFPGATAVFLYESVTGRSIFGERGGDGIANPFLMIAYSLSRREPWFVAATFAALAVPAAYWLRQARTR